MQDIVPADSPALRHVALGDLHRWSEHQGANACLHLAGELDLAWADALGQWIEEAQLVPGRLVLDLRGLTFIDGSGVRAIVDADRRSRDTAHRITVLRGPPSIDRVFELTGAAPRLEIVDCLDDEPLARSA